MPDRRSPHGLHVIRELDELYCPKCRKRWSVDEEAPGCDDRRQVYRANLTPVGDAWPKKKQPDLPHNEQGQRRP
jgi:uncharacterized protein YbaR (Trm112 family)